MATIGSSLTTNNTGATQDAYAALAPQKQEVDKNVFLQLLVAQLRNQDPMNPTDGTQFLTQLAQFQQLEQSINSGQDITAIRNDMDKIVAAPSTDAITGGGNES